MDESEIPQSWMSLEEIALELKIPWDFAHSKADSMDVELIRENEGVVYVSPEGVQALQEAYSENREELARYELVRDTLLVRPPDGFYRPYRVLELLGGHVARGKLSRFIDESKLELGGDYVRLHQKPPHWSVALSEQGILKVLENAVLNLPYEDTEPYQKALNYFTGEDDRGIEGGFLEDDVEYSWLALSCMSEGVIHPQKAELLYQSNRWQSATRDRILPAIEERALDYSDEGNYWNFFLAYIMFTENLPGGKNPETSLGSNPDKLLREARNRSDFRLLDEVIKERARTHPLSKEKLGRAVQNLISEGNPISRSVTGLDYKGKHITVAYTPWFNKSLQAIRTECLRMKADEMNEGSTQQKPVGSIIDDLYNGTKRDRTD
jgi:hypothetical protein